MRETIRQAACGVALILSLNLFSLPVSASPAAIRPRSAVTPPVQASSNTEGDISNPKLRLFPAVLIEIDNKTVINKGIGIEKNHINSTLPAGEVNVTSSATIGLCFNTVCTSDADCGAAVGCVCNGIASTERGFCGPPLIAGLNSGVGISLGSTNGSTNASIPTPSNSSSQTSPYSLKPIKIILNGSENESCPNVECQSANDCGSACNCVIVDSSGDVPIGKCLDKSIFTFNTTQTQTDAGNSTASEISSSSVQPFYTGLPHFTSSN